MFVRMAGRAPDGGDREATWELVAESHRGREIPCMGAVALLRRALSGRGPRAGAMPCLGLIGLDDYLHELRELPIEVRVSGDA